MTHTKEKIQAALDAVNLAIKVLAENDASLSLDDHLETLRAVLDDALAKAEPQGVEPIEGLEEALSALDGNERFPTSAESRLIYEAARAYLTLTKRGA